MLTGVAVVEAEFRLTRAVLPTHYRLDIEPHLEDDNFTLYGEASISFSEDRMATGCEFARSTLQSLCRVGLNSSLTSNTQQLCKN
jgi:hypothetical protein